MAQGQDKLGAVFDAHTAAEFKTRDIEATRATMAAQPHVAHVPTMTGGHGHDAVRRFCDTWFIGHWPDDLEVERGIAHGRRDPGGRRGDLLLHP
jgi:hypothetical protein